jgi:hypothetical protein
VLKQTLLYFDFDARFGFVDYVAESYLAETPPECRASHLWTGLYRRNEGPRMSVTVIIDSKHRDKTTPAVGDKVRVKARNGFYVVLRVHLDQDNADLLSCEQSLSPVDLGVPLSLIQPANDYLAELFRWYVESAPEGNADGTHG